MTVSKRQLMTMLGMGAVLAVAAGNAVAYTGQKLAGEATVTLEQARAIALKAHAGKVTDEELEREEGGSGLRYSFDIQCGKVT